MTPHSSKRRLIPAVFRLRRRALQSLSLTLFASGALLLGPSAKGQNTEKDVLTTATDLSNPASYSGGTLPGTTNDLTFINSPYSSTTFTLNTTALSIGTLNDLDATQALTINATQSITLNGGANSVSGTPADLLYVATGANLTVAGAGGIVLAANGNFDIAGTAQINTIISGTGFGLTKTGVGTLTLGAGTTYNGATTITAGTLQLGDGTAGRDGSVTGNITNNASLVYNLFGNQTYGSVISGTGSLTKTGAGTLILFGNQTFSGGTVVNGGILQLNTGGQTGTVRGVVTVNSGGTLYLSSGDALGYGGDRVTTLNVNGGTVDNRTGNSQGFVTNFVLTGANIVSSNNGTYDFALGSGITVNASATTTVFGATLNARGDNGAPGGLYSVPISVAAGTTPSGVDFLVSGVIAQRFGNAGGITKSGAGTMAVSAANTYQGPTTISAGTFQLGNGGTTGSLSPNSAISNSGTFAINRSNAVSQGTDFSGAALTGTGGFTQRGTGTTTLNAANTFTGPTLVNAGTLNLIGSLTSPVTVNSGGTLTGFGNGTTGKISNDLTVAGGGAITLAQGNAATPFTVGGALTLGGTGPYGAGQYSTLNFALGSSIQPLNASGTLTLNSGGAYINLLGATALGTYNLLTYSSLTGGGSFSLSSTSVTNTATIGRNTYTLINSNPTSLQLQVTGAAVPGVAYFNGAVNSKFNDLSNASVVNFSSNLAGTTDAGNIPGAVSDVILSASNAPPARTASVTLGGSTTFNSLNVNGNGTTTIAADGSTLTLNALADSNTASDNSYTGNAAGTGINIASNANAFTVNVPVALGNSQSWTNRSANLFTVGGASVTGTATTGNTQTLTLANTSTGGTTVNAVIGNGTLGGTLALAVNNTGTGATILTGANNYTGGTTITAGTLQINGAGVLGTGAIVDNGSLVFNTTTAQTFNTAITGSGALTQSGTGALTLNGNNTFSGGLSIGNGSTVNIANTAGNLGAGTVTVGSTVGGTATLNFINNNTITYANNFVLNGGTLFSNDGDVHLGNATSTIAVNGATTINRVYGHGDTRKKLNFDGIMSGSGSLTLNGVDGGFGEGAGLLIGNNANTYSGTITVNSTTGLGMALIAGGNTALQFATVNVLGNGNGDVPYGLRFNPGVTAPVLANLQGDGRVQLQDLSNASIVLTTGGNNANVTYSGVLSGTGGLTKAGTGTMTLNTADTYTGPTTVTGGTLNVPGSLPSSTVTVNGGTLNLTGTLAGSAVTVNSGGTFTEGTTGVITGAGSLTTFSNVTLATTNTYTGATTVRGGTLTLTKAGTAPDPNTFLTTGGTLAGTSGLTVNTGGTLVLGASNSISSGAVTSGTGNGGTGVTLSGGMLTVVSGVTQGQGANVVGGMNDGSKFDVPGLGNLTLTVNSTLNFAGTSGTLVFNGLTLNGNALSIGGTNFATLTGNSADGTRDRFIVENDAGPLASSDLALITFANYGNSPATNIDLGFGFYEIIPLNAVPEPSTWAALALGVGVLCYVRRSRMARRSI